MGDTFRQVIELFDPAQRWKLVGIFAAMVTTGVLQTAGVASIMPFVALVANPELAQQHDLLRHLYELLGFTESAAFLMFVGFLVLTLIAASNAFMALTMWISLKFTWRNHHLISARLLEQYLNKPYSYYLKRNTAEMSKTLLGEVKEVIKGVVVPGMEVMARSITALFVTLLLIAVDPLLATTVALVLGGAYALVYLLVRRRQRDLGARRTAAAAALYQIAGEAFGGIKDVKVLGRESSFVDRFKGPSQEYSRTRAANAAVSQLPGYALETLAFGGIVAVLIYLLHTRETLEQVLPLIALYALAGNRLMPAFHQIFGGLTNIRFNLRALEILHEDLCGLTPPRTVDLRYESPTARAGVAGTHVTLEKQIEFRKVCFSYPESSHPTLQGVDLVIPAHTRVGLVGATGCGKTTVADLLLGLFAPGDGQILIDGVVFDERTRAAWLPRVGYVPQSIFLCDDTIARNIAFGIPDEQIDQKALERAVRTAHLHRYIETLPRGYDTVVGERGVRLSGGERQRIGIARALYHTPELLVMDEATSALDTVTEDAVMLATRELAGRCTMVLIAHRLTTVQDCDILYLLDGGRVIAQGSYAELTASSSAFQTMAGLQ